MSETIYTMQIDFADGPKDIEMTLKSNGDIESIEEGKIIILELINGMEITGVFVCMDGGNIILKSLSKKHVTGWKRDWVISFLEEIKPEQS